MKQLGITEKKQQETHVVTQGKKKKEIPKYLMGRFICQVGDTEGYPQINEKSDNLKLIFLDADFVRGLRNSIGRNFQLIVGTPLEGKLEKGKFTNRHVAHGKRNGKSYKVIKHGILSHQYNEIWCFLMREQYIKMKIMSVFIKKEMDKQKNQVLKIDVFLQIDVYLSENAINDQYELKILNMNKGQQQQKGKKKAYEHRDDAKDQLIRFTRLSLLLLFDFFLIEKTIPSMVRSDRQFKIFFKTFKAIAGFYKGYHYDLDFLVKEMPKILFASNQQKDRQLNSQHNNKLYPKDQFQYIAALDNEENADPFIISYEQKFKYLIGYQRLMKDTLNEYKSFVRRSQEGVLKAQKQQYEIVCYGSLLKNIPTKDLIKQFGIKREHEDEFIENVRRITLLASKGKVSTKYYDIRVQRQLPSSPIINTLIDNSGGADINQESISDIVKSILKEDREDDQIKKEMSDFLNSTDYKNLMKSPTPATMRSQLKPHQQQALTWMMYREKRSQQLFDEDKQVQNEERQLSQLWEELRLPQGQKLYLNTFTGKLSYEFQESKWTYGGILADEMGLGKTLMALALIHQTKQDKGQTLIVVPKSVIAQWKSEITLHSSINSLKVLMYYDIKDRKNNQKFKDFDIIITTYAVLGQDYQHWISKNPDNQNEEQPIQNKVKKEKEKKEKRQQEPRERNKENQDRLNQMSNIERIQRMVQRSKGKFSEGSESDYDSDESYKSQESAQSSEDNNQEQEQEQDEEQDPELDERLHLFQVEQVRRQTIFEQFALQNKVIFKGQNEKEKSDKKIKRPKDLNCLFDHSFLRVILDEAHNIKNRTAGWTKGAVALKTTYKWCLTGTPIQNKHDDLFSLLQFLKVDTFGEYFWWNTYINKEENEEDQQNMLQQILRPIVLRRVKDSNTMEQIKEVQEQIIWIKLSDEEKKLYDKLKQGTQSLFSLVNQAEKEGHHLVHIFQIINKLRQMCSHPCMALKGIDNGNNMEEMMKKVDQFFNKKAIEIKGTNQSENYRQDQINRIKNKEITLCSICLQEDCDTFSVSICAHVFCDKCFQEAVRLRGTCPQCRKNLRLDDLMSIQVFENEEVISVKKKDSSKLIKVVEEALLIKQKNKKVLIFTQWIEVIGILQQMFEQKDLVFRTITGSMTVTKRSKIIEEFKNCIYTTALILSIKASSTGLNLTMANHVFIVDPWWNPAIEEQAIGRAHRIGQTQQVFVKRFLCKETIEEKINILHQKKKNIFQNAMNTKEKKLDKEEIQFLLQ
ncbi:hypothetical protein pb186bvf_012246 [Paramecium bursaria]